MKTRCSTRASEFRMRRPRGRRPRYINPSNRRRLVLVEALARAHRGAVYLKVADIRDLSKVSRWKLDPTHRRPVRDPARPGRARARARDITGNEIKKIANNSNPNCHGHIPRQTAIRSRGGEYDGKTKRERRGDRKKGKREKEKEKIVMKEKERKKRESERASARNHSTTFDIDASSRSSHRVL